MNALGRRLFPAFAIVLLALLSLAALPAGASARGGSVVVRALIAGGPQPLALAGARVKVVRDGVTIGRARTGSLGVAAVKTRARASGKLRVLVAGGRLRGKAFGGVMSASVVGYRWPRTVHVDPVTTIVSRFLDNPRPVSVGAAERRARALLRLPRAYVLGLDGRSRARFDGRRFLAAARSGRGFDALVDRMVRLMRDGKARRSFVYRAGLGRGAVASSKGAEEAVKSAAGIGEAVSAGTGFFEALEKTDYVLDFADAIVSLTGVGDDSASAAELQQLSAQLQTVQEGITNLRFELSGLRGQLSEGEYASAAAQNAPTFRAVESAADTVYSALLLGRQGGCSGSNPKTAECEAAAALLGEGFLREYGEVGPSTTTQVNSYATAIGGDAVPNSSGLSDGLLQLGSALTVFPGQLFYTAAESERFVAISSYWISSYAQALVLAPIYWRLSGQKQAVWESGVQRLAPFAEAVQRAAPAAVAEGTVLDLQHGLMWSTRASLDNEYTLWSTVRGWGPWRYANGTWIPSSGSTTRAVGTNRPQSLPNADWQVAGREQVLPLVAGIGSGAGTTGQRLVELSGIERGTILPSYGNGEFAGAGVTAEPTVETSESIIEQFQEEEGEEVPVISGMAHWPNSSCRPSPAIAACVWPIWIGNGAEIANLNLSPGEASGPLQPAYTYREAQFEPGWLSELQWGVEEGETLYGSDPLGNIPYLMYRAVTPGECYFYAGRAVTQIASPGCPG